ncbi:hypothetical protein Ga0074115_11283, partial [endosymbiont of Ridgeia piscesae]
LHYIFPFLITLFFYRSHGKQYTLPILSERLIQAESQLMLKSTLSLTLLLSSQILHADQLTQLIDLYRADGITQFNDRHEISTNNRAAIVREANISHCGSCLACHSRAESGSFDEHQVNIPGFGRWDD